MAGQGWRMLVEQLSVGRGITLPSNALGGAKAATFATAPTRASAASSTCRSASSRRRRGARAHGGYTYIMDARAPVTAGAIDRGEKPSVPSAMLKYHVTEMAGRSPTTRWTCTAARASCLGPRNYLGRGYQGVPIAITVEGANILTRSLIIFGQGACAAIPSC
jgi:acyl-CoA dehydrogenase